MTLLIVTTSFAAGWSLCWATTRYQVRNAELRMALTHAWQGRPADLSTAIRQGQGAD
jgi:hypothetical protein